MFDEFSAPRLFPRAVDYGRKTSIGGGSIHDIPSSFTPSASSVSVHRLTRGCAPQVLLNCEVLAFNSMALRAIAAELRQEDEETGPHNSETIQKAKDPILASRTRIEVTPSSGSAGRPVADRCVKAPYGFARMMEKSAISVLLGGVKRHPEARLVDLPGFMTAYHLRSDPATTPLHREFRGQIYPEPFQLRTRIARSSETSASTRNAADQPPMAAFGGSTFENLDGKSPTPPAPRQSR